MAEKIQFISDKTAVATVREGHPRGLYVLFFTEAWERYSFYSMMSILVLYMDESLGFSQSAIGQIYGGYIAAVYFMPLIGGWIADRRLGYKPSALYCRLPIAPRALPLAAATLPP